MRRELLATVLLLPGAGLAYELTGVTWDWQDHALEDPFYLAGDSFPSDVDTGEVEEAVLAAMETWNAEERDLSLLYGGATGDAVLDVDGHWNILWYNSSEESGWEGTLAFAGTWTWSDLAGNDCDVVMLSDNDAYGGAIPWSTDPVGASSDDIDAQAVLLHELGHCLGLDHSAESTAVMYAYYGGLRELSADDQDGLAALYGEPCVDGDGDGFSDCTADCADDDAAIFPGAGELCNGVDDDCDGVVDLDDTTTMVLAEHATESTTSWASTGNVFRVTAPTALRTVRQRVDAPEGARLVWVVATTEDGMSWTLVRSERGLATGETWEESPDFLLPLEQDHTYAVALGVMGEHSAWYRRDKPEPVGPLTPLGYVYGRALGDDLSMLEPDYVVAQEVTVVDLADPDGDGWTAACGDCDPMDPDIYQGAAERCNALDDDCDGEVDEDFAVDSDGDGQIDCLDPCPDDVADDSDGDGACDSDDPCPDDAADDSDGDGSCDSDDPCPDDPTDSCDDPVDSGEPGDSGQVAADGGSEAAVPSDEEETAKAGCSSLPASAGLAWILVASLVGRRRRVSGRPAQARCSCAGRAGCSSPAGHHAGRGGRAHRSRPGRPGTPRPGR